MQNFTEYFEELDIYHIVVDKLLNIINSSDENDKEILKSYVEKFNNFPQNVVEAILEFSNYNYMTEIKAIISNSSNVKVKDEVFMRLISFLEVDNSEIYDLMISLGYDINMIDEYGGNILHDAVEAKDIDKVKYLINKTNVKTNATDIGGAYLDNGNGDTTKVINVLKNI